MNDTPRSLALANIDWPVNWQGECGCPGVIRDGTRAECRVQDDLCYDDCRGSVTHVGRRAYGPNVDRWQDIGSCDECNAKHDYYEVTSDPWGYRTDEGDLVIYAGVHHTGDAEHYLRWKHYIGPRETSSLYFEEDLANGGGLDLKRARRPR